MRQPIIAANWKMSLGTANEALAFIRQISHPLNKIEGIDRVVCPPFTVLSAVAEVLQPLKIGLGAQNMHWNEQGAHTGEISPSMIEGLCQYVILGHSERRATGSENESDESINRKVHAAFAHNLIPILCVGENLKQNEAGETHTFVAQQVQSAFSGISPDQAQQAIIAYEPIWAIGSGKAATPADANRVIGLTIRGTLSEIFGEDVAQAVRVQYGGSVNKDNIQTFMTMPDIDGALVGGSSLKPTFVNLVRNGVG